MNKSQIKTPWYAYYNGIKEHLDYPDISMYILSVIIIMEPRKHIDNFSKR